MKHYSKDTISKIGNAIVYLSDRIPDLSKTKLLKLLYLLEECSAIKNKTPFFGLNFEVWQAGPVIKDVYIDLSNDQPSLLKDYITTRTDGNNTYISGKTPFCDDEFSDIDIELIEYVVSKYGNKTAKQLVKYTHNKNSAWYKAASENGLIELFNSGRANHSNIEVDLTHYLSGCDSQLYAENKEVMDAFNMLKK
ncbi:MAG: Panacea domain-containing protein [Proteiniphilum sp.]|jgi:uncharacterized phage-associated protein|uniref:Panacea domain-containing protein n=1 Tax=Proteiniphilum sp. TaxID=1926877 RepID=UPI002B206205|nr:Panacea domain-containing protein [Proteiniphilum sp.]MEA5128402.1 Panacea domain-containing protein [Proteiniphilum sp.]